jgi:hypothetical protein
LFTALELAAVDGHARLREETHLTVELNEARAHLADGAAVVLAEIGDSLVVGDEAAQEPHELDVASRFPLEPPARLHAVEIAVDVELQEHRGVIVGPAGRRRLDSFELELGKIERTDEGVDHAHRIVFADKVIEPLGRPGRLPAIRPRHEPLHQFPPQIARRIIPGAMFSHSQGPVPAASKRRK